MKRKIMGTLFALVMIAMIATPVLAAGYSATLTVSETLGTDYDALPVSASIDNLSLIDSYIITSSGLDTRVTLGSTTLLHMIASDRVNFVMPVEGTIQYPIAYTAGNDMLTDFPIVLGYGGYFTVNDAAALEPGNNFTMTLTDTFVDTSNGMVGNTLADKDAAITMYVLDSDIIVAFIEGPTLWLLPASETANGWSDSINSYDNDTGTRSSYTIPNKSWSPYIEYSFSSRPVAAIRYYVDTVFPAQGDLIDIDLYYDGDWHDYHQDAPTDVSWQTINGADISSVTGARVRIYNNGVNAQTDYIHEFQLSVGVEASVSSGEYDIELSADGTNLILSIDGVVEDTVALGGASVPDNANNWTVGSDATPYIGSFTFEVDGVTVAEYNPSDIVRGTTYDTGTVTVTNGDATVIGNGTAWTSDMEGSTFISTDGNYYVVDSVTDATRLELSVVYEGGTLSAQSYNMYPCLQNEITTDTHVGAITWGINPTGIDVSVGALLPSTNSQASVDAQGNDSSFVPETGDSEMSTSGIEGENLPFYGLIKGLLTEYNNLGGPDIPMADFWKVVAVVIGWCFGTMVMIMTRNVIFGMIGYVLGFSVPAFSMSGMLDTWIPIVYGISALCLAGLIWKWTSSSIS